MNILVVLRMVPDVVEELEISPDGRSLDYESLRFIVNESDEHSVEEALLLKERHGGRVTVVAPDAPEIEDALFAALAKGADRALKIEGVNGGLSTRVRARIVAEALAGEPGLLPADLILTGVQASDDLDGLMAPLLAHHLQLPHVAIVTGVTVETGQRAAAVLKEYAGGVRGEYEVVLPAVLGIQAAEKPPRYIPVAKVRAAMKSQKIATCQAPALAEAPAQMIDVVEMRKPEATGRAEMLAGAPEDVSARVMALVAERGVL